MMRDCKNCIHNTKNGCNVWDCEFEKKMTNEEAIKKLQRHKAEYLDEWVDFSGITEALDMAVQSLTAISELSERLKAVNRYDWNEKVLIGFNMAVAIFNECFGESCALKIEQSENVGMCQQNVGEMSEKTDGDLISRDFMKKMGATCIAKRSEAGELVAILSIDNLPSAEKTAEWISVSERLPEKMGTYLVTLEYKEHGIGVTTLWFHGAEIGWDLRVADIVLAWMPLPEPYKEEEE